MPCCTAPAPPVLGADPATRRTHPGPREEAVNVTLAARVGPRRRDGDRPAGHALGIVTADCAPAARRCSLVDRRRTCRLARGAVWASSGNARGTTSLGADRTDRSRIGPCIRQDPRGRRRPMDALLHQAADNASFFAPGRRRCTGNWTWWAIAPVGRPLRALAVLRLSTPTPRRRSKFSPSTPHPGGGGPIGHQISIITQSKVPVICVSACF